MDEAYRLTFDFNGKELMLKSVRRLTMRVPPGQSRQAMGQGLTGRFVELRDEAGQPLYRRQVSGLVSQTVEYPTGDPARPFGRKVLRRHQTVAILVPALPHGRTVAVVEAVGRPADQARGAEAAEQRELVIVDLASQQESGDGNL